MSRVSMPVPEQTPNFTDHERLVLKVEGKQITEGVGRPDFES
jgi:hypothetical protein